MKERKSWFKLPTIEQTFGFIRSVSGHERKRRRKTEKEGKKRIQLNCRPEIPFVSLSMLFDDENASLCLSDSSSKC